MGVEQPGGVGPFEHPAVEHAVDDQLVGHFGDPVDVRIVIAAATGHELGDGGLDAVEPGVGIAHREDHLGVGVMGSQLAPVAGAGPVDLGAVATKDRLPVGVTAIGQCLPAGQLLRMVAHLEHMVRRAEAQVFQGDLQRIGAGAPKARADDLKRHFVPSNVQAWRVTRARSAATG